MASYQNLPKNPKSDGTGINKRCLRRDINKNAALGATADRAYKLLTESKNIDQFYNTLLGTPPPRNDPYPWGVSFPLLPQNVTQTNNPRSTPPTTTFTPSTLAATQPPPQAIPASTSTTARSTASGGSGRCRIPRTG